MIRPIWSQPIALRPTRRVRAITILADDGYRDEKRDLPEDDHRQRPRLIQDCTGQDRAIARLDAVLTIRVRSLRSNCSPCMSTSVSHVQLKDLQRTACCPTGRSLLIRHTTKGKTIATATVIVPYRAKLTDSPPDVPASIPRLFLYNPESVQQNDYD